MIPLRALLVDRGVLRDLLGELNHGPSGKIGNDNRLVSGKVLTSVRQEVLAIARQTTATEHPPTRVLLFLGLFFWGGPVHQLVFAVHMGIKSLLEFSMKILLNKCYKSVRLFN